MQYLYMKSYNLHTYKNHFNKKKMYVKHQPSHLLELPSTNQQQKIHRINTIKHYLHQSILYNYFFSYREIVVYIECIQKIRNRFSFFHFSFQRRHILEKQILEHKYFLCALFLSQTCQRKLEKDSSLKQQKEISEHKF